MEAKNKTEAEIILSVNKLKNELAERVKELKYAYTILYGFPKYVKIPEWIYRTLFNFNQLEPTSTTFLGLKICSTKSIQSIDEIEVF